MKNKIFLASFLTLVIFSLTACISSKKTTSLNFGDTEEDIFLPTTFYGESLNATKLVNPKNYDVLGPVIVEVPKDDAETVNFYSKILKAAIAKYPQTDAVINIVWDSKTESTDPANPKVMVASGIAIDITDTIVSESTVTVERDSNGNSVTTTRKTYKKLQ